MKISEKDKLRFLAALTISLLLIGTVFYHYVESFSWLDSLYFCTMTLATVGYGDLVPETAVGKLFTIGYILSGIGIIAVFAQTLIHRVAERRYQRSHKNSKKTP
jgi:voltage-gated potassium channel